jgi:hypothetical protein
VRGDGGAYVPLCSSCVERLHEATCAVCGDTASTWTGSKDATLYVDERPGLDVCPACARMLETESREAREVLRA